MADYTVINGTDEQIVNINGGGTDVDAFTFKTSVTLTNTELADLITNNPGVAVMNDDATAQQKRVVAVASAYASA